MCVYGSFVDMPVSSADIQGSSHLQQSRIRIFIYIYTQVRKYIYTCIYTYIYNHIEIPTKTLDYFLRSNKSNIIELHVDSSPVLASPN